MSRNLRARRFGSFVICSVVLLTAGLDATAADQVWVKRKDVTLRAGQGGIYKPVGTARMGDALTVLEMDGKWLKVESGGKTGWVYQDALHNRPIDARTGLEIASSGAQASAGLVGSTWGEVKPGQGEMSVAGRGWEAERYQRENEIDAAGL